MPGQIFRCQHRVTYAECAPGNHVYYSHYLEILEAARGEFFRDLGKTFSQWQADDTIFPVIEIQLRYKQAARYDDLLGIELWVTEAVGARLSFGSRISSENNSVLVEGETRHVCTGLNEKPKRVPPELIAALKPFFHGTIYTNR
jgi:acyl-CoA thioester hydrolase